MKQDRETYLSDRLETLLARRSPPRSIANVPDLCVSEIQSLMKTILRFAPYHDYISWWEKFQEELLLQMKTRSWPIPSEMKVSAEAVGASNGTAVSNNSDVIENHAVERMTKWFESKGSQLPGHGSPSRTADLIRRGIFKNERQARFLGFDLDEQQAKLARTQRIGTAEWNHHVAITARIRGVSIAEAESTERYLLDTL